jgi:DNA modification methylase
MADESCESVVEDGIGGLEMISLVNANSLHIPLAAGSVHMIATSPPYFGLRDYGVSNQLGLESLHDCLAWARNEPPCGECYVCAMRQVAAELWRVLRDDGVLFLNLGDSYAGGGGHSPNAPSSAYSKSGKYGDALKKGGIKPGHGLKPKDLIGIPWRVALALQADGWYLRSDIIWSKPNPMPESVQDRPTKAHEYVFILSKSARYYYDADAVREDGVEYSGQAGTFNRTNGKATKLQHPSGALSSHREREDRVPVGRNKRTVWHVATRPYSGAHFATWPPDLVEPMIKAGCPDGGIVLDPFAGSGTTGVVARQLGRSFVGLDLSFAYLHDNARSRLELDKIDAWMNGIHAEDTDMNLPLFEAI